MENEDGSTTQVSEAQLVEWVEEGQDKLNKHDLKGAEMVFWKVLNNTPSMKPKTSSPHASPSRKRLPSILENEDELVLNRPAVTALLGLAEVFTKKGRGVRHNDMEWHRMYIQAISSGQQAMTCCDNAIELSPEHKLSQWFSEQKQKSKNDLKVLEDTVVRSVQERLIKKQSTIAGKLLPKTEEHLANPCNMEWLTSFRSYFKEKSQTDMDWSKCDFLEEEPKQEEKKPEVVKEEPKRKKLDYKKVQDAIQKLVRQISTEMKTLKIHPGLTPEEKLNLVSPMNENYDIIRTVEKLISMEESSEKSEDENGNNEDGTKAGLVNGHGGAHGAEEAEMKDDDGINLGESASERGISASKTLKYKLKGQEQNLKLSLTQVSPTKLEPLMEMNELKQSTPRDFDRERPKGSFGFTTLKHGVLTVWRSYDNLEHAVAENNLKVPTYSMEAYEELSPLTELPRSGKDGAKADEDPLDYRKPNSDGNLSIALAHVIGRLADKMKNANNLKEAMDLYKFSLGIFQDFAGLSSSLNEPMAHILRNLGIIKCSTGDFISGSQLLENCIHMYESNHSEGTDLLVARTWYDLGNAFLSQQWDDHVMKSVKNALETEVKRDLSHGEDLAEDSDDDNSSAGESYWVSNQEAIECYKNALAIVQKGRMNSTENVVLYVELLNRIGDCSIASGNYEHAILCYEEAIYMFKTVVGSAMIELNAHALTMLGTANFLMSNFSKAVSMYETAQLLHQHIYGSVEDTNFEVAFTLTMLAISFYSMKHFHKSIAWCLKAFELYTMLYQEKFHEAHALQKWFVTETLYLLGFSYSTLSFYDKSLHYLSISKGILTASHDGDAKQCVRILKCMADVYQSMGDEESALKFYDEALEWSGSLGYEKSATALQNQLLNRMAGVHVNSKDYDTAAKYLEQALDCQKSVENTIKDDLIGIQRQLGVTYTLAGDLDRAIECYTECHEAYEDIADANPSDVAKNLGTLGTLYHVKACLQEDNDEMFELLGTAERYYQEALELDSKSSVSVEYANFLYHQAQCADALIAMLPMIHSSEYTPYEPVIEYNGVEQAILPEHIQPDVDDMENVIMQTDIFARFLAVLCYRSIDMNNEAEDNLIDLLKLVLKNAEPLNYSLLGHAMMEMGMYQEAASSFADSASLQHDNELSLTNHWIALCTWVYTTIEKGVRNILIKHAEDTARKQDHTEWASRNLGISGIRDSGYYDHSGEDREEEAWMSRSQKEPITEEETWEVSENTIETPAHILEILKRQQIHQEDTMMMSTSDIGYNSTECIPEEDDEDMKDETWNDEETVETPAALLELLKKQQEETDKVLEKLSLSHQNLARMGQDDNVDDIEEGLGKRWDRHQEDMEDKSEQILQAITQRQSQLEGMLSTIKRSMENVADSDTSLNEYKPPSYLSTSSTEDVRRGRLGGGFNTSSYTGRTVSNEDIRHGGTSEIRMSKSSEDLRRPRISITQSSEDILTDALNTYRPSSVENKDVWTTEETSSETQKKTYSYKHSTGSPQTDSYSLSYVVDEDKPWKRNKSDVPLDLSPNEDDTATRLQRYKLWAEKRNIPVSSPVDDRRSSKMKGSENTNASNNNDNFSSSFSYTSQTRSTKLGPDNNNSGNDVEEISNRWGTTQHYDTSYTEKKEPVVEDRASRMKRYATLTSTLSTRNPYQGYSDSLSSSQQEVSYTDNTLSSQRASHLYSQSESSRGTWEDQPGTQDEEEQYEEVWESVEEVVETPPEILQLLRAKQQIR